MLGKPSWFRRRKYLGWGVHPKTWQGWVYLIIVFGILALIQFLPFFTQSTRVILTVVWAILLIVDIFDIMIRLDKDEREKIHEAIEDRNALWVILIVLICGMLYQIVVTGITKNVQIDFFIFVAIIAGALTKTITYFALERKD